MTITTETHAMFRKTVTTFPVQCISVEILHAALKRKRRGSLSRHEYHCTRKRKTLPRIKSILATQKTLLTRLLMPYQHLHPSQTLAVFCFCFEV